MTSETERRTAKRAAQAMRAAAIRLALQRADRETDPTLAYGCVDWFRYDAGPAQGAPPSNRTRSRAASSSPTRRD